MPMTPPRPWLACTLLVLAALAQTTLALRFNSDQWDFAPGRTLNVSWTGNTEDVGLSLYFSPKVPGRSELMLEITLTDEDQKNNWVSWNAPSDLPDALYQFTVWDCCGADYRVQLIGDPASVITSDSSGSGLSGGAKAGIGVSVTLIILGLIAAVLFVLWRRGIILNQDRRPSLVTPEPTEVHGTGTTPKPQDGYYYAAEVSGDYAYHEMGNTADRVEMNSPNTYAPGDTQDPSQSTLRHSHTYAQADSQHGHNTPDGFSHASDQEFNRSTQTYSQAFSQLSEPTEHGRNTPQAFSQSDTQDYPHQQSFSQEYLQNDATHRHSSQQSDVQAGHVADAQQTYHHSRQPSGTQSLMCSNRHSDVPSVSSHSRRQSYAQNPAYNGWPSPPEPARWS